MDKNKINSCLMVLAVTIILIPKITFATSGACSYHSGVNCSAGASYFGKVQCNDGWINSSVYFSNTEECQTRSLCVYPTQAPCDVAYAEQQAQQRAQNLQYSRGLVVPTPDYDLILCKDEQALYQIEKNTYDKCVTDEFKKTADTAQQVNAYIQKNYDEICVQQNGSGSVWNKTLSPDINGLSCTKSIKITTNFLPNATINKPYVTDINYTGTGNPVFLIDTPTPDGLNFGYISAYGYNGTFTLRLSPYKVGTFTFKLNILLSGAQVGSKSFNLTVDDPTQVVLQPIVPTPITAPVVAPTPVPIQPTITPVSPVPQPVVIIKKTATPLPTSKKIDVANQIPTNNNVSNIIIKQNQTVALLPSSEATKPTLVSKIPWYKKLFRWFLN